MTRIPVLGVLAAGVLTLAACTSGGSHPAHSSSADLGAVPIPKAPTTDQTATASAQHPALIEMGAPLRVTVGGATALVTASGPTQSTEYDGGAHKPTRTGGTFAIAVRPTAGSITLGSGDFSSRDETGTPVSLKAVGARTVRATAAHPATIKVAGTYGSGAAQLTWRDHGTVLAVWDFNIELD